MEHTIKIQISENGVNASLEYNGRIFNKTISGNVDFTTDCFIPVFKEMGVELLCDALLHKDSFTLEIKYPDINDEYDGFIPGEVKVVKERI